MKSHRPQYIGIFSLFFFMLFSDMVVLADDSLTMGIFTRRNSAVTINMFKPIANHIETTTGVRIKLETAKNFPSFWKNVTKHRYDISHFNQLHYLISKELVSYEVFAKNEEFGRSDISPAIVVRKDSGINSLQDLKGKSIIFGGGKLAMISFIGPMNIIHDSGLNHSSFKTIMGKNPPNAAMAVFFKQADAAGLGDFGLSIPLIKNKMNTDELKYLAVGKPQPHLPWVIKKSISPEIKQSIITSMLALNKTKKGKQLLKKAGMTGLIPASDEEYNISRREYKKFKQNHPDHDQPNKPHSGHH